MPRVNPFKGTRYNVTKAGNIADLLAPPYDVISPAEQNELYNQSDYNVVRLILGEINDDDTDEDNRYTRSAETLRNWLDTGVLERDDKEALYLYAQDFDIGGETLRRTGFICRRLVEPLGSSIHPHERTLSGPKTDRLNLTRACETNFSQVFTLYSDPTRKLDAIWSGIMEEPAEIEVTDKDGVKHMMWVVTDADVIKTAQEFLEDIPVVIADGHHRYETAINYMKERSSATNSDKSDGYKYAMMYLANSHGEGFTVLATHRVVISKLTDNIDEIKNKLSEYFDISEHAIDSDAPDQFMEKLATAGQSRQSFGLYAGNNRALLLELKEENGQIEVITLQDLIFEKVLGISREAVASKKSVAYTIDASALMNRVDEGDATLGFLLNPTDIDKVFKVATGGGVMPQKSTYFYPKLISGLVMNQLI